MSKKNSLYDKIPEEITPEELENFYNSPSLYDIIHDCIVDFVASNYGEDEDKACYNLEYMASLVKDAVEDNFNLEVREEEESWDDWVESRDEDRDIIETPCDGPEHQCPFADTYTGYESEICRNCCGLGVDENLEVNEN